jgi:hypothetical protein
MQSIRSSLLLQLVKGRDSILFISVYCSRLGPRTRGSRVCPFFYNPFHPLLSTSLFLSAVLASLSSSLPTPITPLPSVEDANISTGPSPYPSYPLSPIRNNMYPRRPPNSLRLVFTPLQLKSTSYKHSTRFEDVCEPLHYAYRKKGDGWYEGSGMVGFTKEG